MSIHALWSPALWALALSDQLLLSVPPEVLSEPSWAWPARGLKGAAHLKLLSSSDLGPSARKSTQQWALPGQAKALGQAEGARHRGSPR